MLPTKVPSFREIIVMNLVCDDCGFRSSEVNFGGELQAQGQKLELTVVTPQDLNRQMVKSDSASLFIPKLEFEIPPSAQRGVVSTIEGVLQKAADNLEELQPERLRLGDVDNFHRCHAVIESLRQMSGNQSAEEETTDEDTQPFEPFQLILDDPAGNSFIENPLAPLNDPNLKVERYIRTPNQDMALGLQPSEQAIQDSKIDDSNPQHKNPVNVSKDQHRMDPLTSSGMGNSQHVGRQEVMVFPSTCPNCHAPTDTKMCVTDVPHFKEVIIMSMVCDSCGFKSNEIKGGGAIPKYGCKITVDLKTQDDLSREVLKSDTAGVAIPELELELSEGGLDGLYTTIEGLLEKMHERLLMANPFESGDSAVKQHISNDGGEFSSPSPSYQRYQSFLAKLKDMASGKVFPFTLVISDPLANSFVGPPGTDAASLARQAEEEGNNSCYDKYVDTGMEIEEYQRTEEQNESLGLNDIKTENYQESNDPKGYYGTDQMEELPDRIRRVDLRGPDHPHEVGKAPVEGDTTVMGPKSLNYVVPSIGQRGKNTTVQGETLDKDDKAQTNT